MFSHLQFAGFHPVAVHFPITALLLAALCDLLALILRRPQGMRQCALLLTIVGTMGAIGAVVTGSIAEEDVIQTSQVSEVIELHETLGYLTMWIAIGILLLRSAIQFLPKLEQLRNYLAIVSLACAILVAIAGHYGGELVYRFGANTLPVNQSTSQSTNTQDTHGN